MNLEEEICLLMQSYPSIHLALLFGSLGRDQAKPSSDLDLAAAGKDSLGVTEKMQLIEALAELSGRPVDLITAA